LTFHFVLCEVMQRGLKSKSYRYILPWFVIILIEELVIIGLGASHLGTVLEALNYSYSQLFYTKGGFMVITPFLTG
jgi:hypothetical protein